MQIGFIGLGRMGQAMVPRLLQANYAVSVWNRTPARAEPLLALGASLAASPAALARQSDLILSIVTDDAAVEALFTAPDGLLAGDVTGRLFIEMSTIRPDTIRRVAEQVAQRGAALIDSPVSGTVVPAREGRLMALVGGVAADVERAQPVLEVLCRRVAHLGPVGSGAMMKLALNMPMAVYWQALAESLAMGTRAGLDLAQMLELIADSPASIGALPMKIPQILQPDDDVSFNVTGVRKDLIAMTTTGQSLGVPTPSAAAALASFAAATASGWGERDLADYIPFYLAMVRASLGEGE